MDIFRNLKAAFKYANYDFYSLKKEVVELVKRGREQGFNNPDYCKLTICNSPAGRDYPVQIDLYYKTNKNEAMYLPQQLLIGTFATMPSPIKNTMLRDGVVEITINNLAELCMSAAEEVGKPIKFESITNFGSPSQPISARQVTIKDELFSYRVIYSFNAQNQENKTKVVSYADIVNLPLDVATKLKEDGICVIKID